VVLSPDGGALPQMLSVFRKGLGGKLGSGKQWMSWVAIDDAIGALEHALDNAELAGPFNVVAPEPVTNAEFAKTVGQKLGRPTVLPAPASMLRMALGELADETLLASQRVEPAKLQDHGYRFRYTKLEAALGHLVDDKEATSSHR